MPTLRQLRYLTALAEERHFGRAAAACNITQPALSMQIRDLEAELGLVLVERGRGGVALTPDGQALAERARTLTTGVKDLEDFARERRGVGSRRLALGLIPTIAPYLLPRILPLLQDAIPDLDLKIRETRTAVLMAELAAGDLDAVIAALPLHEDGVEVEILFEDPFALPGERLLLLEEGHCLRDQALGVCEISDLSTFGATSLTTLLQLVAYGQGVTLLPQMAASDIADPRIALRRFPAPQPSRTIAMAWRSASPRRKQLKEIAARVRAEGPATPP
jgi:LysR family hydrogen peroxide-inducible transcriptional activator